MNRAVEAISDLFRRFLRRNKRRGPGITREGGLWDGSRRVDYPDLPTPPSYTPPYGEGTIH